VEVSVDVGDWITNCNTPINRKATIIRGFHVCQFDSDSFSKLNREGGNLLTVTSEEDMVVLGCVDANELPTADETINEAKRTIGADGMIRQYGPITFCNVMCTESLT
jgi:hypothetical protein